MSLQVEYKDTKLLLQSGGHRTIQRAINGEAGQTFNSLLFGCPSRHKTSSKHLFALYKASIMLLLYMLHFASIIFPCIFHAVMLGRTVCCLWLKFGDKRHNKLMPSSICTTCAPKWAFATFLHHNSLFKQFQLLFLLHSTALQYYPKRDQSML